MTDQPTVPPAAPEPSPVTATPVSSAQPAKRTSVAAIVSLVAGILTWFSVPLLFLVIPTPICAIAAIVAGHMARAEIRRAPDRIEGNGLALTGLILGWSLVVIVVLSILVAILFLGGIAALVGWLGLSGQLH
jgi:hypothetical protein